MAIRFGGGNRIPELGMIVYTTVYEKVGDKRTETLLKSGLGVQNYARRVCVIRGDFSVSYPESNFSTSYSSPELLTRLGGMLIWPLPELIDVKKFTVTATQDDSAHHCINPIDATQQIQHTVTPLTKNSSYVAKQGSVYCTNVDYKINGITQKAGVLIVCSTQDATIIPQADGAIAQFTAVTVEDASLLNRPE